MNNKAIRSATVLALGTALISGVSNFMGKMAVTGIKDPVLFTTLKNAIVAVLLLSALLALKKWPEIKRLTRAQWGKLFAVGIVGGSIPFALFFTGLSRTSAVNAALIHKSLFIWVLILGIPFLKERLTRVQWAGVAALFAANLAVGGFTGFAFDSGEGLVLLATLFWAVENIIAKKALADISSSVLAAARMTFGSLVLFGMVAMSGNAGMVFGLTAENWGWVMLTSALLFGYVTTWYTALKHAPATYVATLLVPATLITNSLSAVFVTHALAPRDALAMALYAAGVFLFIFFARRSAESAVVPVPEKA